MALSSEQIESFNRDGCLLVPDLFSPAEMDAALAAADDAVYGKPFASWLKETKAGQHRDGPRSQRIHFVIGRDPLDRLIENDDLMDAVEALVGDVASLIEGYLFVRKGPMDDVAWKPWQGFHMDHHTCTLLPPTHGPDSVEYLNAQFLLHDVAADGAPMMVIPGSNNDARELFLEAGERDNTNVHGWLKDLRESSITTEPVPITGKAGSVFFWSSYTLHGAQPFENKEVQRSFWYLSFCRRQNALFTCGQDPLRVNVRNALEPFFARTTPRVRTLMGCPEPGDPYWTEETITLLERHLPEIDMGPYRERLKSEKP